MKRRAFVTSVLAAGVAAPVVARGQHEHAQQLEGPLASATVSFGAWPADPAMPFDRRTHPAPPPPPPNLHALVPYTVKIKAGGTVNYIISGLHQIQVYAPGTTVDHLLAASAIAGGTEQLSPALGPGLPPALNVAEGRVFRGIVNPGAPDRVEVVHFPQPGTYLVVCGIMPHLIGRMHGWVTVLP
jgi:plastocyanin